MKLQILGKDYNEDSLVFSYKSMEIINVEAFKNAWLNFEDIEWIKRWLNDLENWNIYEENEFYSNLEKKIFSKKKSYV